MLITTKESGCPGFYFPVPWDCIRARLSLGARLPSGQAGPLGQPGPHTIPQHREVKPRASLRFCCHYISTAQYSIVL